MQTKYDTIDNLIIKRKKRQTAYIFYQVVYCLTVFGEF